MGCIDPLSLVDSFYITGGIPMWVSPTLLAFEIFTPIRGHYGLTLLWTHPSPPTHHVGAEEQLTVLASVLFCVLHTDVLETLAHGACGPNTQFKPFNMVQLLRVQCAIGKIFVESHRKRFKNALPFPWKIIVRCIIISINSFTVVHRPLPYCTISIDPLPSSPTTSNALPASWVVFL